MCEQINGGLPSGLFADVEVTVYVLAAGEDRGRPKPDVAVIRSPGTVARPGDGSTSVATEQYLISVVVEPVRQHHVVIRGLADDEPLITAIKLLSPTNKRERSAREAYVAKRAAYRTAGVNLLEIDLIRAGSHLIDVPMDGIPPNLAAPYKACVHRSTRPDEVIDRIKAEYYPLPLRERLARVSLPLRASDADSVLDLQVSVDAAYAGGRYGDRINYSKPLDPPLVPDDAAWAAERIAAW